MALNEDGEIDVNERTIVVRLTQWDLVVLNVGFMPRLCALWVMLLLVALGAGFGVVLSNGLHELTRTLLVCLCALGVVGTLASMAGVLAAMGIVSSSPVDNPLLGDRAYTFQADGLRTRTGERDIFIEWASVRDVRCTPRFILIDVAPGLFHALPRRNFESPREYQAFWNAARRQMRGAWPALS
jgi:hypothetical protein